jgi:hypothetical protein
MAMSDAPSAASVIARCSSSMSCRPVPLPALLKSWHGGEPMTPSGLP